jgi:hypothetical protein
MPRTIPQNTDLDDPGFDELDGVEGVEDEDEEDRGPYDTDDIPESFENVELTTQNVREIARNADQEKARVAAAARGQKRNTQDPKVAQRRHDTPQKQAARAQQPKRENPVAWQPATSLEAPPAPRGMVLRWIRYKLGDKEDSKNISRKFREGWVPYLIKDCPEDYTPPESARTKFGETISVGSLILCMMPRDLWKKRQEYFRERQARQFKSAHNKFRAAEDPNLPIYQTNKDSFSRGRRTPRSADE